MISKVFYTFVYSIVKNMSKKTILVYIGIGCLLAVLAMWSFRSTERRMLEVAEHTFVDAVHQDLDERKKKSEDLISFFSGKTKEKYVNLIIPRMREFFNCFWGSLEKRKGRLYEASHKDVYQIVGVDVLGDPQQTNFGREIVFSADLCYNDMGDENG